MPSERSLQVTIEGSTEKLIAQIRELAFQAFVAGAKFAGADLEDPQAQFDRHWAEQLDRAGDEPEEATGG